MLRLARILRSIAPFVIASAGCRERAGDVVRPDPTARPMPSVVASRTPPRVAASGIVVRIAVAPAGSLRVGIDDEPLDTIAATTDPKAFAEVSDHVAARRLVDPHDVVTIDADSAVPMGSVRALLRALESVGARKLAFRLHDRARSAASE